MKKNNFLFLFLGIILTFGLTASFDSLLAAWVAPTANPPANNTDIPINVGSDLQAKGGPLWIESSASLAAVEASLRVMNSGTIDSFKVEDEFGDATPFVIDSDGNVGIGVANPQAKLDIAGGISSDSLSIRSVFVEKELPMTSGGLELSPTCTVDESELPPEVLGNGRCSCDVSDSNLDCSVENLIDTDYPGCFDRYKKNLDAVYANYPSVACHDLVTEGVRYFEAWNIEEDNNRIDAPFESYDNCNQIYPNAGDDLGVVINDGLKKNSCLSILLRDAVVYYWEEAIEINPGMNVSIRTINATNFASGGQAKIIMQNKKIRTYNGTTYRAPGRAYIEGGQLYIGGVFIGEKIADARPISISSGESSLFNIGLNGVFTLYSSEVSATEDLVNFAGGHNGGIFRNGHLWLYRNPISPRANLYAVRAYSALNFTGQQGTVGWSDTHVHLNQLNDGTTGSGVQKYPSSLSEKARLLYPDDVAAAASDIRYKKDIIEIDDSLSKILQINGVEFKWRDEDYMDGKQNIGLIAQDVEKVFPEVVITNEDGYKSVEYDKLVAPLIEAIKEQQKEIEELKNEINSIKGY